MKKIVLILPWFGNHNYYFDLFLLSCEKNPTIDFLFFTDVEEEYSYPSNIKVINISFKMFSKLFRDFYDDFEIRLERPYKLCDFKPAYGEVLYNYIKDYDFYGYCDCDLIFGDIRTFVTEDILNQYNKIFTRGHFTLYRNIEEVRTFYRKTKYLDYRKVFSNDLSSAFDEWGGISAAWQKEGLLQYDELVMDDIIPNWKGLFPTKILKGDLSPYHAEKYSSKRYRQMKYILYSFENGKLFRHFLIKETLFSEEILYVHLQKRKMRNNVNAKSSFLIKSDEFLGYNTITKKELKKNGNKLFYFSNIINLIKFFLLSVKYKLRKKSESNQ